jgi:hypothetical protein
MRVDRIESQLMRQKTPTAQQTDDADKTIVSLQATVLQLEKQIKQVSSLCAYLAHATVYVIATSLA